jgi:hypothetical protein
MTGRISDRKIIARPNRLLTEGQGKETKEYGPHVF